ncbi:MAG: penicillin-binding transpeptidase domain-containing protein [Clostridia bacterium]|nr:penicillin-binding transpeptidase domain-containing protein [Clostridia bacterium]
MRNNRKMFLFLGICLIFFALLLRLFYIQVIDGSRLSKAASAQRITNSIIQIPRGRIIDKNGISFTNRKKKVLIIIKPLYLNGNEEDIKKICGILGEDFNTTRRLIEIKKEPIVIQADEEKKKKILDEKINGVSAINYLERYDEESLAKHILGYLNSIDKTGQSGLEKFYESALKFDCKNTVGVITDARNNLLEGLGYRIMADPYKGKKLNLKLTLDYHIQKIVEEVMEKNSVKGAVVVEDVYTGDIVAIASKPDYDQNSVGEYLNSPGKELFNKATAAYNMGSIFKIIDTAKALETELYLNPHYFCPGFIRIGNKTFKCHKQGGHGWVDLKRAFALSCNTYFIDLGIRAGHSGIIDMAKKFGLGEITGVKEQGVSEATGRLPETDTSFTRGDTANISIGQGEVMVTPLQVVDLIATVANGGIKNRINIVDSVIDDDGNKVREVRNTRGTRIISKETSDAIKEMMIEVVLSGTGSKANMEDYGGAGGKTGSAETGQLLDGEKVIQAWFAGFFPKVNPKYSIAVFVENGRMGNEAAAPIFREIAVEIVKKGY